MSRVFGSLTFCDEFPLNIFLNFFRMPNLTLSPWFSWESGSFEPIRFALASVEMPVSDTQWRKENGKIKGKKRQMKRQSQLDSICKNEPMVEKAKSTSTRKMAQKCVNSLRASDGKLLNDELEISLWLHKMQINMVVQLSDYISTASWELKAALIWLSS